jgi:membrane-bound acyltransferase YfiQ involved in biofilm formation
MLISEKYFVACMTSRNISVSAADERTFEALLYFKVTFNVPRFLDYFIFCLGVYRSVNFRATT